MTHTQVIGMERAGNRIQLVHLRQHRKGRDMAVEAEQIVNATGAWAGQVSALAGIQLPTIWSKGTVLVTQNGSIRRFRLLCSGKK